MTKQQLQKAKPIIFNTESVRGIIDGRKTSIRQVIKPQPIYRPEHPTHKVMFPKASKRASSFALFDWESFVERFAKYQVGDILYVRETWHYSIDNTYCYRADGAEIQIPNLIGGMDIFGKVDGLKWRPSIHMPKEAARIFLRVTGVRVERLQDITPVDCHKEGVMNEICSDCLQEIDCRPQSAVDDFCGGFEIIIDNFADFWNSKIKKQDLDKYGWEANPYVWVYEFERVEVEE